MARRGIEYSEVETACSQIWETGGTPSAKKVREHLGRGSLTTISKYLNMWKKRNDSGSDQAQSIDQLIENCNSVDLRVLSDFVDRETPQVAAILLSKLAELQSVAVLKKMDLPKREDVLSRIENLGFVSPSILKIVFQILDSELAGFSQVSEDAHKIASRAKSLREKLKQGGE